MKIRFNDFIESRISGKFITNPYWLEYLLNLFFQGYLGEVWEEVTDTKINNCNMLESLAYNIIGDNFKEIE